MQNSPLFQGYAAHLRRKRLILLALVLLMLLMCACSLAVGSAGMGLWDVLCALAGKARPQLVTIVHNVRLPRALAAVGVGVALAMSGCIMQNVLRNPLASASTLGVSQGASFGAAVAIVWLGAGIQVNSGASGMAAAITITNPFMVMLCAFAGGMATTLVILALARGAALSPAAMALAGVAISSLFAGATALVQYFCDDVVVATIVYWTFGSLGRAGAGETLFIFIACALALAFFAANFWNYNALESGSATASSLGVNVRLLIPASMAVCSLVATSAVAFVGCINFIGLIAPHMARRLLGSDHRHLLPASALVGAVLMLAADIASRTILAPVVLPIGALTSFLGAPVFLWMIVRSSPMLLRR